MKLLIDFVTHDYGSIADGFDKYALDLVFSLIDTSQSNELVCLADPIRNTSFEYLRQAFIRRIPIGNFIPFNSCLSNEKSLNNGIEKYNPALSALFQHSINCSDPDLVLSFWRLPADDLPSFLPNYNLQNSLYPHVVLVDSIDINSSGEDYAFIQNEGSRYYQYRDYFQNVDFVLTPNEETREAIIKFVDLPRSKVAAISSGECANSSNVTIKSGQKKDFFLKMGISKEYILLVVKKALQQGQLNILSAYSTLPVSLRENNQVVIYDPNNLLDFQEVVNSFKLSKEELVIIHNATNREVSHLIQLSKVFINSTGYEGFRSDLIDAMKLGIPILTANSAEAAEIIDKPTARFDLDNPDEIFASLNRVLSDKDFRNDIKNYSIERGEKLIWDGIAKKTWTVIESIVSKRNKISNFSHAVVEKDRPKVAFLSPLPPEQSGIADYSFELIPYLSKYFDIDLFGNSDKHVQENEQLKDWNVYPWKSLSSKIDQYATVIYQFGNSPFHEHMVELMEKYPGVLVLHDFYIGHLLKYMHFNSDIDLTSDVDTSHGLKGLLSFEVGGYDAIWNWPINWRLFKYSSEVIAHSEYHYQLLRHFYDKSWHPKINVIPQLRKVEPIIEVERKKEIRASLGIEEDCFLFCSFGQLGRNKANLLTVKAFMQAREFIDQKSKLIFVGSNDDPELISAISELIKGTEFEDKIDFTGHVEQIDYENYLRIADVAIQLRINSRGETSRAVLDCMANGNPVILNEHGTNEDFQKGVLKIADPINQQDLIQAMVDVAKGKVDIHDIGDLARDYVSQKHNPETIGNKYREVVERTIQKDNRKVFGPAIQNIVRQADFAKVKNNLALCAAKNLSIRKQTRILVDVSEINRSDLQSGIQRVVKQILTEWLQNPAPTPFIEPVYIDGSHLYRASRFSAKISGLSDKGLITEREIFIQPGDILLFLDAAWGVFEKYGDVISEVRNCGGKVVSVLYDMIPIEFPQFTNRSTVEAYHKWFNFSLHESDALVCISKTVAESVERYLATNQISLGRQLDILHFHLGADIPGNTLDKTTNDAVVEINRLSERPEYLMVGTIEPRKGHDFVLDCFEEKW